MRIYLIRHGETIWNREKRTQGWTDIELNSAGHRHAAAIGLALRSAPLDAVYASSLARAITTARAIAAHHGLVVAVDPDLRELNQGTLDGLTTEQLRRGHGALLEEWRARASTVRMPGGESMAELQERAWQAIRRIVDAHPRGTVAAVSHNLAIVTVLCRLMGIDLNEFRRIRQDVAAINVLEFEGPMGAHVVRMNDTGHVTLGQRVAGMLAGLRDAAAFEPVPVSLEDLAAVLDATGSGQEFARICRVVAIAGQGLVELKTTLNGADSSDERWPEALYTAPAVVAVLAEQCDAARVEAMVLGLRVAASALGYGTARLSEGLLSHPVVLAAADARSPWGLSALLALGLPARLE